MGLSRRKFTSESKTEVVRRLELGASVAEVARTCELNPNVLHRWRRERRENGEKVETKSLMAISCVNTPASGD
jgi:transposase-like protein